MCDFFKLEDNYRAIKSHKTVENLVKSVYFNENKGHMEVLVSKGVLETKTYLKDQLVAKMKQLQLISMPVIIPISIAPQHANTLLDAFRQQIYENSEMRMIMFELEQGELMTVWVRALVKDSEIMIVGWNECLSFTTLVFSDDQKYQDILIREQSPDQFLFLKQKGNWLPLFQEL